MQIFTDYKRLQNNAKNIRQHLFKDTKLCAVVKANGYGHNIVEVAKNLQNYVDYFAVARVDEGIVLRQNNISKPILVLCPYYTQKQVKICAQNDISLTVDNLYDLQIISRYKAKIHLKIDSGMHRVGIENADDFLQMIQYCVQNKIDVQGVYSHFASDLKSNAKLTINQYKKFCEFADIAKQYYPDCIVHLCNSINTKTSPACHFDMVRTGIDLYDGCKKVVAKVVATKQVKAGDGMGYNHCFVSDCEQNIAIVDCGYGDGLPRRYNGWVDTKYGKMQVVGNACMDMIMIKNSQNLLKKGDKVVILGEYFKNIVKADEIAKNCDTISYEILCNLRER